MNFTLYVRKLQRADKLAEQIARLEGNLYYVHPSTLSDMPRGSLVGTDGVTDDLCKLAELRDERDKLNEELYNIRLKYDINQTEFLVVYQREVLGTSWKEIAERAGYSVRHTQRILDRIVEKFSKNM